MGIELPKDIQDMAMPVQFDVRGKGSSLATTFGVADAGQHRTTLRAPEGMSMDDVLELFVLFPDLESVQSGNRTFAFQDTPLIPDEAVHKQHFDKKTRDDLNNSGLADDAGLINTGQGEQRKIADLLIQDKEDEKNKFEQVRQAIMDSANRLRDLNLKLEGLMEDLGENLKQQAANTQLIALLKKGELKRDNPDVAELIIIAGLDPSMSDDDLLKAAEDQIESLKQGEAEIRTEIEQTRIEQQKEADRLKSVLDDPDSTPHEKEIAKQALAESPDVAYQISLVEDESLALGQAIASREAELINVSKADVSTDADTNLDIENAFGGFDEAMPMP